ncbi:MAG TPA: hypothetical protein VIQ80_01470 [Candidatus Saccharimonadales bacterium]
MLKLRRRQNPEKQPSTNVGVPPTHDRPLRYLRPEAEDSGERRSRVEAEYTVVASGGAEYNVTELIMGRTVTLDHDDIMAGDIMAHLYDMSEWVLDEQPGASPTGGYLVEYPRAQVEAPIDAVFVAMGAGGLTRYEMKEVGDQVLILSRTRAIDGEEVVKQPRGARITSSVRARIPANGSPLKPTADVSYEEALFERIRDAVVDYNQEHATN